MMAFNSGGSHDLMSAAQSVNNYFASNKEYLRRGAPGGPRRAKKARQDALAQERFRDYIIDMPTTCAMTSCWGRFIRDWAFVKHTRRIDWRTKFWLFPQIMDNYQASPSYIHQVALDSKCPFTLTYDFRNQLWALGFPDCLMLDFDVDFDKLTELFSGSMQQMKKCMELCAHMQPDEAKSGANDLFSQKMAALGLFGAIKWATDAKLDAKLLERPKLMKAFRMMIRLSEMCDSLKAFMEPEHPEVTEPEHSEVTEPEHSEVTEQTSKFDAFACIVDTILRNIDPDAQVHALLDVKKMQVLSYCQWLVAWCPLLTFALFETDRGVHAFLVSTEVDCNNLMWIDFMLKVCNDTWYSAFTWKAGFFIRLNKKEKRTHDFVAKIGVGATEDTHQGSSHAFRSAFWGHTLSLAVPPDVDDLVRLPEKQTFIVGRNDIIDRRIYQKVQMHFLLVQYFKEFHGAVATSFECSSGDYLIRSMSAIFGREADRDGDPTVSRIRRDVVHIASMVNVDTDPQPRTGLEVTSPTGASMHVAAKSEVPRHPQTQLDALDVHSLAAY